MSTAGRILRVLAVATAWIGGLGAGGVAAWNVLMALLAAMGQQLLLAVLRSTLACGVASAAAMGRALARALSGGA
eukprot:14771328-Alexandrium_andersonii.AAC.1